jgi:hypothetical protein
MQYFNRKHRSLPPRTTTTAVAARLVIAVLPRERSTVSRRAQAAAALLREQAGTVALRRAQVVVALPRERVAVALRREPVAVALRREPVAVALRREPVAVVVLRPERAAFERRYLLRRGWRRRLPRGQPTLAPRIACVRRSFLGRRR